MPTFSFSIIFYVMLNSLIIKNNVEVALNKEKVAKRKISLQGASKGGKKDRANGQGF